MKRLQSNELSKSPPTMALVRRPNLGDLDSAGIDNDRTSTGTGAGVRLLNVLWPGRWLILTCASVCALAAVLLSLSKPPKFRARTSIEIQDLNTNFLQMGDLAPVNLGRDSAESPVQTEIEKMASKTLIARVVKQLKLDRRALASPASDSSLHKFVSTLVTPGVRVESPLAQAVAEVGSNLDVVASRGSSRIISIEYTSTDPELAAAVANGVAEEYVKQGIELRMQAADRVNQWMAKESNDLRRKLEQSEAALQQYGQTAGLLFTDERNSVAEAKLNQLQEELSRAQSERISKQSRFELISKASPESLAQIVGSGPLHDYEVKLTDAMQQLAQASAVYTPSHPRVQQLQAQIDELTKTVEKARIQLADQVTSDYNASFRAESLLRQAYVEQAAMVSSQDSKASQYNILKGEVETNRGLYASLLQKVKNASISSALHSSNIAIFDRAQVPSIPFEPKPIFNGAVGLFAGAMLSSLWLFLRGSWDKRIQKPGETLVLLNIPELGMVPALEPKVEVRRPAVARPQRFLPSADLSERPQVMEHAMMLDHLSGGVLDGAGITSSIAESFRGILASLALSSNENAPRVIVVTSASQKEGKTVTVTNLGVALASIGKKVVLIDGDLRRPRLHEIFSLENGYGFSDLLSDKEDITFDAVSPYLKTTEVAGLSILTSGKKRAQPSKLLYTGRVRELFEALKQESEVILIDTPPVLAVADTRILSAQVDGVVLVCRAGSTERESMRLAANRLLADDVRLIGTILNGFDITKSPYKKNYYSAYPSDSPAQVSLPKHPSKRSNGHWDR